MAIESFHSIFRILYPMAESGSKSTSTSHPSGHPSDGSTPSPNLPVPAVAATPVPSRRLFLACVPRTVSTSLTKCLSAIVQDCAVWFEPYVTARHAQIEYERQTGRKLPTEYAGNETEYERAARFMAHQATSGEFAAGSPGAAKGNEAPTFSTGKLFSYDEIKKCLDSATNSVVVVKDFGLSLAGYERYLPSIDTGFTYVFLIRDPYLCAASYRTAAVAFETKHHGLQDEAAYDLSADRFYPGGGAAFARQHELWRYVRDHIDPSPLVIDSHDLLSHPSACLRRICEVSGLEYRDALLHWDASHDGIWKWNNPGVAQLITSGFLDDFHSTALKSSCFTPLKVQRKRPPMTADVQRMGDGSMPYYKEMHLHRFIPPSE